MNISIIGTGYVGLVSGACFAKLGHNIICIDNDEEKINKINNLVSPIYEPGLDDLLTKNKNKITATTDLKSSIEKTEITFICVGTPSKEDGDIDLSIVKDVAIEIGEQLRNKNEWHIVIVKSTVTPGTTINEILPVLEKYSGKKAGKNFGLAMNPEFLREGTAIKDFLEPDRIIYGYYDEKTNKILGELYKKFKCPIIKTSVSSAEMIKYASNAFLATKISFINEIGNLCKKLNIDSYEVADGMGLDKRIGRDFLDSGIGWGGSCFPKDLDAIISLANRKNETARVIKGAIDTNDSQPLKLIEILKKHIPNLSGKTIGILGLSFKPNTDDIRESRAIPIVQQLIREAAIIKAYDPVAMNNFRLLFPDIEYCLSPEEILKSDAVLIVTKWNEFKKLNYKENIVIDGRRLIEAKNAKIYEGVCW